MRRSLFLVLALVAGSFSAVPSASADGVLRAGVGIADATWHVGVGSGQYTDKDPNAAHLVIGDDVDPHNHSITQRHSYGVQSRLTYRTLVVEGSNGERVALVKSDAYLAQDMLTRRVAQLLEGGDSGIAFDDIVLHASHNHSSPYYFTPSWGVWLFQDVFEIRAFEYHARQMAASIEEAADNLVPARMGGTTIDHRVYKGNIAGTTTADDGSPGGYPDAHADFGLSVLRFDDISNPDRPAPLAVYANFGQHPESLDGYDLITADFLAPLERFVDRELGAPLIFSQGDVGSAEGPYFRSNFERLPDGVIRAWAHVGHAQTERGARYLADDIERAWDLIGSGQGDVPMTSEADVAVATTFIPGPVSHPYPSVSNCRTEPTVEGAPGAPILGLPDCARGNDPMLDPVWESLTMHGLPLPEHYDAPAFTGVEENLRLKLQAVKIGDVIMASCSCEAQMDLILNLESRLDRIEGNIERGFDWSQHCAQTGDDAWTCDDPWSSREWMLDAATLRHMQAQVNNPADGWDAIERAPTANAEPDDPEQILGNFSSTELDATTGYGMAIGLGHTGDYLGYVVSYREYMSRDHYRKALTAFGPHTADYMNSRLVAIARELNGGAARVPEPHEPAAIADELRQEATARALGAAAGAAYDAWVASLPDDAGAPGALTQPEDITRFDAAEFTWVGGSNAVDNPVVRVERETPNGWEPFADHSGEVQTRVEMPDGLQGAAGVYAGSHEWHWTANFEAFDGFPDPMGDTPSGRYRFVVDGHHRSGREVSAYRVESDPFTVGPWTGVTTTLEGVALIVCAGLCITEVELDSTTDYPRSYDSSFRYVADDGNADLCKTCTFRPWASTGRIIYGVIRSDEGVGLALWDGSRLVAYVFGFEVPTQLWIEPGDLIDEHGETNGARIDLLP